MLTPPLLWPSVSTPTVEIAAIKELHANLWGVAYNVEAWAAALRLYQFAEHRPSGVSTDDARRWKFIASNECVHELHHLREGLEKVKGHKVRDCPSLAASIETKRLRAATKLLNEYFPDIDQLRHAIAHAGANDVLPGQHAPEHGYLLVGFREQDRYTAPYKGVDRHLSITEGSLERIREVANEFICAFEPAAKLLEQEGHLE
jgi:hypothetical protein